MKLKSPWLYSKDELRSSLLFHGSSEPWRTPTPRGGGYDGVFWTVQDPLTAQTYIPDWGGKTLVGFENWKLDEVIRPSRNSLVWDLAQTLGAGAEVYEYDLDRAMSWKDTGKPVTYRQVAEELQRLGYKPTESGDHRCWVKTEGGKALPADSTPNGRLLLIEPEPELRKFDMAEGLESDLLELQYHKITTFKSAFEAGFDAVVINDFAQSPRLGNIGHTSVGLSPAAVERHFSAGRILAIAATHRDFSWPMGRYPDDFSTDDFDAWHFQQVCRAIARGEQVPEYVLHDHSRRLDELRSRDARGPLTITAGVDSLEIPSAWQPTGSSESRTQELFSQISCSQAVDVGPAHRNADGTLDLSRLDPDFGLALRKSGLTAKIRFTLDDGKGRPTVAADFFSRVDELTSQAQLTPEPTF